MDELQTVIDKLEEIIAKYQYMSPTIPWGLIRDDLIHCSEKLKHINRSIDGGSEEHPTCLFCDNEAEFEGWLRRKDPLTLQATGLIQKVFVCSDHTGYLIGQVKEE